MEQCSEMNRLYEDIVEEREVFKNCAWCGKRILIGPSNPQVIIMLSEELSEEVDKRRHNSKKRGRAIQLILKNRTLVVIGERENRGESWERIFGKAKMIVTLRTGSKSCAKALVKDIKRELDVEYCKAYIPFAKDRYDGHITD